MLRQPASLARLSPLVLLLVLSPLACLGANASEERQLDEMRREISAVQSDGDKFEEHLAKGGADSAHSRPMESKAPESPAPLSADAPSPAVATPQLPIIHLGPHGPEETGSASATAGTTPTVDSPDRTAIPSFTNANIGSALASRPAAHPHHERDGGTQ